jgi:hypothetical protein
VWALNGVETRQRCNALLTGGTGSKVQRATKFVTDEPMADDARGFQQNDATQKMTKMADQKATHINRVVYY